MKEPARKKVRLVPAEEVFAKARRNPAYAKAYEALKDEFDTIAALVKAGKVKKGTLPRR